MYRVLEARDGDIVNNLCIITDTLDFDESNIVSCKPIAFHHVNVLLSDCIIIPDTK
jgi:hypothetical protein